MSTLLETETAYQGIHLPEQHREVFTGSNSMCVGAPKITCEKKCAIPVNAVFSWAFCGITVPKDIGLLLLVKYFLNDNALSYIVLRSVCRTWYDALPPVERVNASHHRQRWFISYGTTYLGVQPIVNAFDVENYSMIEWLWELGYPLRSHSGCCAYAAVERGRILHYGLQNEPNPMHLSRSCRGGCWSAAEEAARRGDLPLLKWLEDRDALFRDELPHTIWFALFEDPDPDNVPVLEWILSCLSAYGSITWECHALFTYSFFLYYKRIWPDEADNVLIAALKRVTIQNRDGTRRLRGVLQLLEIEWDEPRRGRGSRDPKIVMHLLRDILRLDKPSILSIQKDLACVKEYGLLEAIVFQYGYTSDSVCTELHLHTRAGIPGVSVFQTEVYKMHCRILPICNCYLQEDTDLGIDDPNTYRHRRHFDDEDDGDDEEEEGDYDDSDEEEEEDYDDNEWDTRQKESCKKRKADNE